LKEDPSIAEILIKLRAELIQAEFLSHIPHCLSKFDSSAFQTNNSPDIELYA
jgi:hypothetical protein